MDRPHDAHGRPLRSLRLSVTDRCNLRCSYCMPEEIYTWLPKKEILSFEESVSLVRELVPLGVTKIRLTGGEPLLRRDLPDLVSRLAGIEALEEIALTTNAVRLGDLAPRLKEAGLDRITISLDTLRQDRFLEMTRRDELGRALAGIRAAGDAGFVGTKLNTVVMRGKNDDELADLLRFGAEEGIEIRFIEYMDVGGATQWSMDTVVSASEMLQRLQSELGDIEPLETERTAAPADRFQLGNGQTFGIIASTTRPFCSQCDRARLTADGRFFTCLYAEDGEEITGTLREEGPIAAAEQIRRIWTARDDRGAEVRHAAKDRAALADSATLRDKPHLEMHTRGG